MKAKYDVVVIDTCPSGLECASVLGSSKLTFC